MRALLHSAALLLATTASGQSTLPSAGELTHVRAAFADWREDASAFVIAVIDGGQPIVLCHGKDTNGKAVHLRTLTPIGSLARLLIADAIHVKFDGNLDVPSGVEVAGTKPTILDLVQDGYSEGNLLPDYWDWRSDSQPVKAATLLACANVAAKAGFSFGMRRAGMADMMLLEQRVLPANGDDWPSFLRVMLSPRVSGLAPVDARVLADDAWTNMSATSTIAKQAKPAALRLMVTGKDLANWWRWRLLTSMPLWKGFRMGYRGKATRRDEVEAWQFEDFGSCAVKSLAYIYPAQKSGIMCVSVGPPKWIPSQAKMLTDAFEADLFGELPAAPPERAWHAVARRSRPPLAMWNGKAWATRSDAATPCRIHVANGTKTGLHMTWKGRTYNSVQVSPEGKAMRVVMDFGRSNGGLLWIRPEPDASTPQRLMAVLLEHRADYKIPYLLELRLQENAPR